MYDPGGQYYTVVPQYSPKGEYVTAIDEVYLKLPPKCRGAQGRNKSSQMHAPSQIKHHQKRGQVLKGT